VRYAKHAAAGRIVSAAAPSFTTLDITDGDEKLKLYKSAAGYRAIMNWYDEAISTIDCAVESRFVRTRFGWTHMLVAGPADGAPLVLIPGVAGCAPVWRRQLPAFARHFRVYAVDIVGQPGRSDPNPPSFLNDDYVDWLCDVLDGLQIRSAHLAGTSVGGWVALRMALVAPERVRKIVMLSPTGVSRAKLPVRIWVTKVMNKRKHADALQDDLTAKSVTSRSPGGSFGTFDRRLARLMALCTRHYRVDRSVGVYNEATRRVDAWKGLKVLRKFFLSEPKAKLQKLRTPGLLVFGQHEVLYDPWRVGRRALALMPSLELDVIEGAGHAAIYDKPDEVNERVITFLNGDATSLIGGCQGLTDAERRRSKPSLSRISDQITRSQLF
jgi:pimeloyl-ACP methyl ester carboxylesterase